MDDTQNTPKETTKPTSQDVDEMLVTTDNNFIKIRMIKNDQIITVVYLNDDMASKTIKILEQELTNLRKSKQQDR